MSKIIISFLAGAIFFASDLHAQPLSTPADTLFLDDVVVMGTKIPLSLRETTRPVMIIGRRQIERGSSRDFSQLLHQQSGVRVNNSQGTPSGNQSLFMQGAGGEYSLILIDGKPVRDPSGVGGAIDLRLLPLHNIEQVEVLKGNQSALYGSDALAGVINIITQQPQPDKMTGVGSLSYGAYNTFGSTVGVNGSPHERFSYNFHVNRESSDGISAAADPTGEGNFERDGFTHQSVYGSVKIQLSDRFRISPGFSYSDYDGDYDADAFVDAPNTFGITMFNPSVQSRFEGDTFTLNSNYSYTKTDRIFSSEFGDDEYEGRFHNLDHFLSYELLENVTVLGGFEYQHRSMPDFEDFESRLTDSSISPYTTAILRDIAGFSTELGYRLNSHSEYGRNSSFNISPAYQMSENLKIFAAFGTGFKAPTLNELFGPFGPNTVLDPETSREYRLGFESYLLNQTLKISGNLFNRKIDDLIVYTFDPGYINRDREKTTGIDLSANWLATSSITLGAFYNYLSGETLTLNDSGSVLESDGLIRKPKHNAGFKLSFHFLENIFVQLDGEVVGDRTDLFFDPENNFMPEEIKLDSYVLINLFAEYSLFNEKVSVYGKVRNLLNSDFTEVYGFNTMGVHAQGGVRVRF